MRGGAKERREMKSEVEERWMRKVGKELKKEVEELGKEIGAFKEEIDGLEREIKEIKKQKAVQRQKKQPTKRAKPRAAKPSRAPSLEDMKGEWAVLVATIDKMSLEELVSARGKIQSLGRKLDSALGENYLEITEKTIQKIDQKLRQSGKSGF